MIYSEAVELLQSEGLRVVSRAFGIEGWSESATGVLQFQIGLANDYSTGLSISRFGEGDPLPDGPVRWFHRPTLADLVALLVAAHRIVRTGGAASLFDALRELDADQ